MRRKNTDIKIEIFIDSLAPGGDGTGTYGDKMCFVAGGVPGDTVNVKVIKQDKRNIWAAIDSFIQKSQLRREPLCTVAESCGGCIWQHISYEEQAEQKRQTIARIFGVNTVLFTASREEYGYRRLARLHFEKKGKGAARVGFFAEKAHKIVDIDNCPVFEPALSGTILPIKEGPLAAVDGRGELLLSSGPGGVWLYLKSDRWLPSVFYEEARKLVPEVLKGVVCEVEGIRSVVAGTSDIQISTDTGMLINMPAGSFGQANSYINNQMIVLLKKWITDLPSIERCVELFAGAGNFSLAIAPLVKQLETVEMDSRACRTAVLNFKEHNIFNVHVRSGNAETLIDVCSKKAELVILDPPRTGNALIAKKLAAGSAHTIIYISCNPKTLKRDMKILNDGGFNLTDIEGFDMFPQTPHIEVMAMMSR